MRKFKKILLALGMLSAAVLASGQTRTSEDPTKVKSKGFTKTANPFTHYLYKNGFRDYVVAKIETKTETETKVYNELRFNSVYSQDYTKMLMFNTFGQWDRAIPSVGNDHTLVWRDVKLLANEKETFTVFAHGVRSFKNMYAAVNVVDSQNKDCLAENHPMREKLIKFFSEKIWNLGNGQAFTEAYTQFIIKENKNK